MDSILTDKQGVKFVNAIEGLWLLVTRRGNRFGGGVGVALGA